MSDWFPAWQEAARSLGLKLDAHPDSWLYHDVLPSAHLRGEVEGISVQASLGFSLTSKQAGRSTLSATTVEATPAAAPSKLRLSLARGYIYPLGRPFIQDIRVGDAAFDDRFIVKGSNHELVGLWLTPAVREAIGGAEDWQFGIEPDRAWGRLGQPESSAAILISALRAVARLARRGGELGRELGALAGKLGGRREAVGWDGEAGRPILVDREGTEVSVEHRHGRFGDRWRAPTLLHTRIACRRVAGATRRLLLVRRRLARHFGGRGEVVEIPDAGLEEKYLARAEDPEHFGAVVGPAVRALVGRALPDAVVVDDDVSVWLLGLQLTAPALAPYLELAAALAPEPPGSGQGPYR